MHTRPNYLLRGLLAIIGAVIVFLGLNVGLGGIQTLGWQGGLVRFFSVTDAPAFAVHDNHVRFIGGVWLGLGLLMLAGSMRFQQLRPVLVAFAFLIFIGALARLSGDLPTVFSSAILPSFIFELVLVPLLGVWMLKAERPQ